jgi:hypothetical protein
MESRWLIGNADIALLKTYTVRGFNMIIINIAEWIVNIFILGSAVLMWTIALLIITMLSSIFAQYIKRRINNVRNNDDS